MSGLTLLVGGYASGSEPSLDFVKDVRPILSEACFQCHGPDNATRAGDLRLDEAKSAASALMPDDQGHVPLLDRILADDIDYRMPPLESKKELSSQQKEILRRWVESGAEYELHWAFREPQRPPIPAEFSDAWCENPIDAFVLAELRCQQLEPSLPADPAKLARRLSLDLTGLPLSTAQLDQFLNSSSDLGLELAVSELMDWLMASPRYAEHMALPWLEAARYADTDGYQNDRYRYQHAWRDWVLRAFNEKMTYDQFVIEQLAGDMLPEATLWQQVASGFGRNHRINSEDGSIPEEWLTENVVDRVDTLGTVFLGLTIGCARCHDHKYDPITQKEYYELFAYFNNIAEHGVGPNNGNSPPFVELPETWPLLSAEQDRAIKPEPVKLRQAREESGNGLRRPQAGSPQTVMVMHEREEPRETYRLMRGQYNMPDTSERLYPGVPDVLQRPQLTEQQPTTRLELARWLVNGRNPLTARVAANRLWQQIFGVGIVETSENYGSQGSLPTHPDLLDWLACELVDSGWNMQHIQRLILQSATYRQSSDVDASLLERDPKNRLLARGPRIRMPAFLLRDQALAAAGLLCHRTGGPSAKPYMPEKIWSAISNNKYEQDTGENLFRRSVYTYWRRTIPPPTMMNFNAAPREICTVRTELTNTPLQALTLLNNRTFVEAARCLAERMLGVRTLGEKDELLGQLDHGFRLVTSRDATPGEIHLLQTAFEEFANEFERDPPAARGLLAVGEAPRNNDLDCVRHAAMTMVASMILNLDEAITKD